MRAPDPPPERSLGPPKTLAPSKKIALLEEPDAQALLAACRNIADFADPLLERELLSFARRARAATRGEAPKIVREALLVLGRWGRAIDACCWQAREERATQLLNDGICGRAAVTLLPRGVTYEVETLSPLHDWASVAVPQLGIRTEATAHSIAAALVSAQLQAIAQAIRLGEAVNGKDERAKEPEIQR